jgi:hypothetical protein
MLVGGQRARGRKLTDAELSALIDQLGLSIPTSNR